MTDTPVVRGRIVYTVGQAYGSGDWRVYAFDVKSGRRLWSTRAVDSRILAVSDRTLFISSRSGPVLALDAVTGLPARYAAPRSFAKATYADGVLYVTKTFGSLTALESDGRQLWTNPLPVTTLEAPVVAGPAVYVYGKRHSGDVTPDLYGVYAFARSSGALLWKREGHDRFGKYRVDAKTGRMAWKEQPATHAFTALVADERTAFVWEEIRSEIPVLNHRLSAVDARSGVTKWRRDAGSCSSGPVLLESEELLACDRWLGPDAKGSTFSALKRSTGDTQWEGRTSWDYDRAVPRDRFLMVTDRGVHGVLNENMQTSPDSWLTLVDLRSGKEVWRTEVSPLAVYTLPALSEGVVVVGSEPFTWTPLHLAGERGVGGLWAWPFRVR